MLRDTRNMAGVNARPFYVSGFGTPLPGCYLGRCPRKGGGGKMTATDVAGVCVKINVDLSVNDLVRVRRRWLESFQERCRIAQVF